MRFISALLSISVAWATVMDSVGASPYGQDCRGISRDNGETLQKNLCANGRVYEVYYNRKKTRIEIKSDGGKMLFRIPKNYDPTLVGSDGLIGFLPNKLQIYKKNNVLTYISSIRSSGGDGMGQCGSGSEIYLNFLDVSQQILRLKSKILIGSCKESIELQDQDISRGKLGDISVVENNLVLHFLNYKEIDGEPAAVVGPDFELRFHEINGH